MSSLQKQPKDILFHISTFLNQHDVSNVVKVNKRINKEVTMKLYINPSFNLLYYNHISFFKNMCKYLKYVRTLHIVNDTTVCKEFVDFYVQCGILRNYISYMQFQGECKFNFSICA